MTFPVKWYSSAMEGAPLLSSGVAGAAHTTNPGSLIALLKAVLVTGFGIKSVSSLVYSSAAQTITATVAAGHKYLVDQVIELSGANESGFNGEFRVLSVTSTTVVMGLDNGTPSAVNATGSLSLNIPSLGWAVEFEDAVNYKIIFKRTDPLATPLRLYIDNSAWTGWNQSSGYLAKVLMIENPTDINTFTTVHETRWPCSHNYGDTDWELFGDTMLAHFVVGYGRVANATPRHLYSFGDIKSVRPGDKYHCMLIGFYSLLNTSQWVNYSPGNSAIKFRDTSDVRLARAHNQSPGVCTAYFTGFHDYFGEGIPFPNPADNGFYMSQGAIPVFDTLSYRGDLPGVLCPFSTSIGYDRKVLRDIPLMPNALIRLLLVSRSYNTTSEERRLVGFDIKGPWR